MHLLTSLQRSLDECISLCSKRNINTNTIITTSININNSSSSRSRSSKNSKQSTSLQRMRKPQRPASVKHTSNSSRRTLGLDLSNQPCLRTGLRTSLTRLTGWISLLAQGTSCEISRVQDNVPEVRSPHPYQVNALVSRTMV